MLGKKKVEKRDSNAEPKLAAEREKMKKESEQKPRKRELPFVVDTDGVKWKDEDGKLKPLNKCKRFKEEEEEIRHM